MKFLCQNSEALKQSEQLFKLANESNWHDPQQTQQIITWILKSITLLNINKNEHTHDIAYRYHKLGHFYFETKQFTQAAKMFAKALSMNDVKTGWKEHYIVHHLEALYESGSDLDVIKSALAKVEPVLFSLASNQIHIRKAQTVWEKLNKAILTHKQPWQPAATALK